MLQITEAAETALRRIRQENDVPHDAALRISAIQAPGGEVGIGFAFTDGPEEDDEAISEKEDFQVYLSPELAALGDAALEATSDEDGIKLELRTQAQLHDHVGEDHH
jgi:Fe-S cluster assembly iron-binding protein IscA